MGWLGACLALVLPCASRAQEAVAESPNERAARPTVGLVLSGGGARGVAHIGVLKALEELRVPIDYIAGTSMGAVVGGLYASGMSPEEIERWFAEADWRYLLSDSPPRATRSLREKEREARLNQNLEVGLSRSGSVQLPAGFITGQKVLLNLRELTLPVRQRENFDRLPIPFRAIATDLQSGEKVVLGRGSLAEAMRASMAVPGVFTPFQRDGRLLVDGGLSSNLPIATVRQMGAEVVIAVDVRPDLQKTAEELSDAIAVANQMLDILIQRDTLAQVRALTARDVYVRLPLPGASSSDFAGSTENVAPGYAGAMEKAGELRTLAVSAARYQRYLAAQRLDRETSVRISFLEYPGPNGPMRKPLENEISFAPGDRIERWQLEKELGRIEGFHDSEIADFRVIEVSGEYGLEVETRPKSRGPNFINAGFDFDYTSAGETIADLLLSFRMTELNRLGAEWETFISVGDLTRVFSEWYQPLDPARHFFVAANVSYANEFINALDGADRRLGFRVQDALGGFDLGTRLGNAGELRVGYTGGASRIGRELNLPADATGWSARSELRAALTFDTLDRVNFPRHGFYADAVATFSREELGARANYQRLEAQLYKPIALGKNTIVPRVVAGIRLGGDSVPLYDRVPLGGFLQLSGFSRRGLYDQNAGLAEVVYYRELTKLPAAFGGGVFAGASVEAGDVWSELEDFDLGHLKYGGSIFLGADTIIGPLYLGLGGTSESEVAVYLQLSPIFRNDSKTR